MTVLKSLALLPLCAMEEVQRVRDDALLQSQPAPTQRHPSRYRL